MRVPMNIQGTDHVYLAIWATLTAVHRHNRSSSRQIDSLACPGHGTGTGGVDSREAALQMCLAYEHYLRPPRSSIHRWPSNAMRKFITEVVGGSRTHEQWSANPC